MLRFWLNAYVHVHVHVDVHVFSKKDEAAVTQDACSLMRKLDGKCGKSRAAAVSAKGERNTGSKKASCPTQHAQKRHQHGQVESRQTPAAGRAYPVRLQQNRCEPQHLLHRRRGLVREQGRGQPAVLREKPERVVHQPVRVLSGSPTSSQVSSPGSNTNSSSSTIVRSIVATSFTATCDL